MTNQPPNTPEQEGSNDTSQDAGGGQGAGQKTTTAPVSTVWTFASLLVIVLGLVAITVYVVRHYASATDAGTILGIVIPVFATIGAAIFGVTVAYQAGSRTGQETGRTEGRSQAADVVERELRGTREATEPILQRIEVEGVSPTGQDVYILGDPHPVEIRRSEVSELRDRVERLQGVVRGLRAR